MPARGRPRKSTADMLLYAANDAPAAEAIAPLQMPFNLAAAEKVMWECLAKHFTTLTARDQEPFRDLIRWLVQRDRVYQSLAKAEPGSTEYGRLLKSMDVIGRQILTLSAKFGLTPRDRGLIKSVSDEATSLADIVAAVPSRGDTEVDLLPPPDEE